MLSTVRWKHLAFYNNTTSSGYQTYCQWPRHKRLADFFSLERKYLECTANPGFSSFFFPLLNIFDGSLLIDGSSPWTLELLRYLGRFVTTGWFGWDDDIGPDATASRSTNSRCWKANNAEGQVLSKRKANSVLSLWRSKSQVVYKVHYKIY